MLTYLCCLIFYSKSIGMVGFKTDIYLERYFESFDKKKHRDCTHFHYWNVQFHLHVSVHLYLPGRECSIRMI